MREDISCFGSLAFRCYDPTHIIIHQICMMLQSSQSYNSKCIYNVEIILNGVKDRDIGIISINVSYILPVCSNLYDRTKVFKIQHTFYSYQVIVHLRLFFYYIKYM